MNIIKRMPIAVSGLLLATLSLGNIYQNSIITVILFIIALLIILSLLLKVALYRDTVKDELNQLVVLSTSGTFSMALMLFSTYIIHIYYPLSVFVWMMGILLHVLLIIIFTYKYIFNNFNIENVYGSYWIVYVGITMASITGLSHNLQSYTWIFFVFGFMLMIPTFLLVTYRYLRYPVMPEQNKPLICIYAALFNILIVGYVNSFSNINLLFLLSMYSIATLCYVFSLYKMISYRKMQFYPSYSAYTFPFVISAIASSKIAIILSNVMIDSIVSIEIIIATLLVIYVYYEYLHNIILRR